ncbi:MAG: RNA polymerase sigma factor [Wujia sp.]
MNGTEFCNKIKKLEKQLYVCAYSVLKNQADAEDAVCSAIQKGYEKLDQLQQEHKFAAWIMKITRNEALQIKRHRMELPGDEQLESMMAPAVDNHYELWDMVQKMQEEYREVVVLYYYSGLSVREISQVLDIPVGTVKSRMNRGRKYLRDSFRSDRGEMPVDESS